MTHIKQFLLLISIILALVVPSLAAPPFSEVSSSGGSGLNGKVFVDTDAMGYFTEWTDDGKIMITSITHETDKKVRLKWLALQNMKGWSQASAKVQHINDAGVIDSERIVNFGAPDAQGFVYFTTDFSTVIIGGYQGSYTISCGGVQDNSTNCSLGQSFLGGNVSAFTGTITPATIETSKYDYIASTNPDGWWKLDNDYIDSSGNGNNGTAYGDTHFVNGKYNNGSSFDGSGDYILFNSLTYINFSQPFSLVSYVLFDEFISWSSFFDAYLPGGVLLTAYNNGFRMYIDTDTGLKSAIGPTNLVSGVQYTVFGIYDGDKIHIYVDDGISSIASSVSLTNVQDYNGTLNVGFYSSDFLNGSVDNLILYDYAINETERNNLYYDHLQSLRIRTTTNATWSDYYNSTADNPISINYNIGETISALQFDVPTTAVIDGVTIYDYNKTAQFTPSATVYYGENVTLVTESAAAGLYILNITQTPANAGAGWINYTTANSLLLNADFNNTHVFTTDNTNASVQISLPYINISTGDINANETKFYNITIDYFYPPTGLISFPDIDHIHFDWDDAANVDYWNISELEESAPYVNTSIILDGLKDAVYDNDSHGFVMPTPNQVSPSDYELIHWFRNDTHLIGHADGFDADGLPNDDSFSIGIDNTGDGLTADDRIFILSESGSVAANRWNPGTSSWLHQTTSSEGIVLNAGGGGAISYEMIIPLTEMAGFVNGVTARFFMQRIDSSQNPDVLSFFPETLINTTDATLWANATLTATENYVFVGDSNVSEYEVTNLTPFTWYKHRLTAINGTNETSGVYSTDITLDNPIYTVSGYIIDNSTGLGIPNAVVFAQNGVVGEANVTNASGYYIGHHFHNGTYTIYANADGYDQNNTTSFVVSGANITNKNVTLVPTPALVAYGLSRMPYQIYMMLISIVILLVYFTFTVSDPEYYTDIITALFAMLISAIVAHNSIMGVLIMYPLQTEVQYDIYASAPLGIVFVLVSLLMLLIFVTKILDLGHRETDSL